MVDHTNDQSTGVAGRPASRRRSQLDRGERSRQGAGCGYQYRPEFRRGAAPVGEIRPEPVGQRAARTQVEEVPGAVPGSAGVPAACRHCHLTDRMVHRALTRNGRRSAAVRRHRHHPDPDRQRSAGLYSGGPCRAGGGGARPNDGTADLRAA